MRSKTGVKGWWLALLAVAIDRLGKLLIVRLAPRGGVDVLPGLLRFSEPVHNTGISFSLFSGGALLPLLTAALIAGIVVMLLRHPEYTKAFRAGLWLIAGGGLGNLYDRLVYGYVIDFIEFSFIRFPVFNPADIFICVGAALMLLDTVVSEARKKHG